MAEQDSGFGRQDVGSAVAPCPFAKKDWIEIQLLGEDGKPLGGVKYRIEFPDGSPPQEGVLDRHGIAGCYAIGSGTCRVSFPELDEEAWTPGA
jgi:hypothetical protein